jgi:hypothetical protein
VLLAAGVAVTAASALVGCSESVEEAGGDFCSNLDTLEAELASLESLVAGDATLDDIEAQRDVVADAWQDVEDSAGSLDEAVSNEADSAYDAYQDALGAVPGDATVTEAAPQYAAAVQAYVADLATIAVDAGCESPESPES